MSRSAKLASELSLVYSDIIKRTELKMRQMSEIMGKAAFEKVFADIDSGQRTQTCTKLFQYLVTQAIVEITEENDIALKPVDETGHDWLYEGLPVEQKVKTMLVSFETYRKHNVKGYGVVNTSWTGNKASVGNQKKADTHLLLCFAINGSKIESSMATIISLKATGSEWKTGSGNKDSYGTLTISNHTNGSHLIYGGFHQTPSSAYGLLEEVK